MTKTLVERLVRERHTREDWHEPYGTISLPCDADDYGAEAHLINPDGPEAAAEITRLASRIEELERALGACRTELHYCAQQLAHRGLKGHPGDSVSRALEAATQALSDKG
jgi:hypothetical protein